MQHPTYSQVSGKVVAYLFVELCSYDRILQTVAEKLLIFNNMEEYHAHMARIASDMTEKGMLFNGSNTSRYFNLNTQLLSEAEKRFIFK